MVINKEGDIDVIYLPARCEGKFGKDLHELLKEEQNRDLPKLVIDFKDTTFIDSRMVGILVTINRDFTSRQATLSLKNINKDLTELFSDTGLDMLFNIETVHGVTEASIDIFQSSVDIRLEIETEIVNDVSIFHMKGVMNHPVGSRYFKQQFLLAMAENKKFLLDFENLTFFDSLSVSVVLSMYKLLKETGGALRFCRANYIVEDLFTTLSIDQIIPIFDTVEGALAGWD